MPEGYTHIRTANKAAALANLQPANTAAFGCGANGPDILFSYRAWRKGENRGENLPEIGSRLHNENTGLFLQTLLKNARTPSERSYVQGFLCHYATDCVMHPYVVFLSSEGQLYGGEGGHGYFEIALDSFLHQKDTGSGAVSVNANTPKLTGAALAEAGALLQKGIQAALGVQVSREALADAFWHTRALRRMFVSRFKISYGLFYLLEPLFGGRGVVTGHISPAHLKGSAKKDKQRPPLEWQHPFTGETMQENMFQLLNLAVQDSAALMLAAQGYWDGNLTLHKAMQVIGSASYLSGLEDAQSNPAGATV